MADVAPAMHPLESAYAEVGGHQIHHWLGGPDEGRPVVLVHGFLATGYAWRVVAPALVEHGCRVLVVDLLGYGDSDKPSGTEGYDARALAEQVRTLATDLGLVGEQPVLLVAHDMGAPPALLWAADHPDEVAGLVYVDEPVMLGEPLRNVLAYTPESMAQGSLWWWVLALGPGVPEALVVGNEERFLRWFYDGVDRPDVFDDELVAEYLRTFSGEEGVLGAMGVYRAAFTSIAQTEPLTAAKVALPVVALAGERGLGGFVGQMLGLVADDVTSVTVDCGHFVPEEAPDDVVRAVRDLLDRTDHQRGAPS